LPCNSLQHGGLDSIVPALPPRRQHPHRFQFLIRLPEERNALLALIVLHVVRKAVDVGVPESFAWHQIWRALKDNADFFRQFVFWFLLAAHVRSPFAGLYTG